MVPFVDQDFGEIVDPWFARADEFLLGRTTYEMMFPYWSQVIVTDPDEAGMTGQQLNNLPKHIVSRTLRSPEWAHSSVIDGNVVEAVTVLKDRPGGELQVHGSAQLVQTLNQHRLVDEYRLLVFPVVLGTGKRLFDDGTVPTAFKTVENRTTSTGAVALTLRPTGLPAKGEVPSASWLTRSGTRGSALASLHQRGREEQHRDDQRFDNSRAGQRPVRPGQRGQPLC
jgi:dihydrofolate reductase